MATTFPTTAETKSTIPRVPRWSDEPGLEPLRDWGAWVTDALLALEAKEGASGATRDKHTLVSEAFDLDNGAGTTVDRVVGRMPFAITLRAARIVYEGATTGTVAAGNARVGTTVGGEEIVAATAYGNAAAVGAVTAMTLVATAIAANTPICVRHTGVAATQAGFAHVEIDFTID